jgi:hypothetical protein
MACAAKQSHIVVRCPLFQIPQHRWRAFQEKHDHCLGDVGPTFAVETMQPLQDRLVDRLLVS